MSSEQTSIEKPKMRSVIYKAKGEVDYAEDLKEIPEPGKGQVLIKVECAVINPSDLMMLEGKYSGQYSYPLTPGVEGSGTVVKSGGGYLAWSLIGKRVGFCRQGEKGGKFSVGGAYAEYIVTTAIQCVTLLPKTSWESGACCFVNPITAVGLMDKAKQYKARAVIQTGAASQLGRMIIRLANEKNVTLINIVRREEQVKMLKEEYGAKIVLNSSDEDFEDKLYELSQEYKANVAFECVSGEMSGQVTKVLDAGGVCIVYGQLSGQNMGPIVPLPFIFKGQRIEPFLLNHWLLSKNVLGQMTAMKASKKLIEDITVAEKQFGLHEINEAIKYYKENMTQGKVFLKTDIKP